ncbi:MAG: quinolinate synthase NadA [Syntrophomonadaceae bacterium]|nr:quinolinate synthase NadA [Syntrophomonadaceae bacterium]
MRNPDGNLIDRFLKLKEERSAYVIAHYYQRPEVQDVADFVGDSYSMALAAREAPCETILVAGVDFMAETAVILCPDKTVLTPEPDATCPMANDITARDVLEYKERYPDSIVVCYVNTPAEVKAVSDVCCTSSNAAKILEKMPPDARVFFVPDRYLGCNIARRLNRDLDLFHSCCPTHEEVRLHELLELKQRYPDAKILVHPECRPEVVDVADFAGSTRAIIEYAGASEANSFIIGTECGILHPLQKAYPGKEFILATEDLICPNMKSITLEKMIYSLEHLETRVTVEESIRDRARIALERMIEYST